MESFYKLVSPNVKEFTMILFYTFDIEQSNVF